MKRLLLLLLFVLCIGSVFGETLSYETGETDVFLNGFPGSIRVNINGDISILTRSNELMNQQLGTDSSRRNYISYVNPSGTRFVFDSGGNPFIVQSTQSSGTDYIPVTQGSLVTSSETNSDTGIQNVLASVLAGNNPDGSDVEVPAEQYTAIKDSTDKAGIEGEFVVITDKNGVVKEVIGIDSEVINDHPLEGENVNTIVKDSLTSSSVTIQDGDTKTEYFNDGSYNKFVGTVDDTKEYRGLLYDDMRLEQTSSVTEENGDQSDIQTYTLTYDGLAKPQTIQLKNEQFDALKNNKNEAELAGYVIATQGFSVDQVFGDNNNLEDSYKLPTAVTGFTDEYDLGNALENEFFISENTVQTLGGEITHKLTEEVPGESDNTITTTNTFVVGSQERTLVTKYTDSDGQSHTFTTTIKENGREITNFGNGYVMETDANGNIIGETLNGEKVSRTSTWLGLGTKVMCGKEECSSAQKEQIKENQNNLEDAAIERQQAIQRQIFDNSDGLAKAATVIRGSLDTANAFASLTPALVKLGLFDAEMVQEWRNGVDSAFESVGLTSSFYVKQFCADDLSLPEGKNTAFIEMPDGSVQVGASIQGECTQFTPLNLEQYNDSSEYITNYYIVTGLVKNPPVATNEAEFPLTFQIFLEGPDERVPLFENGHQVTQIPSGQSFSLMNTNAFRVYTNKVFDKVCIEMDNPPEYFGNENRFCNVISCNQLDNDADYSSELPPVIDTPDGIPALEVESGTAGSGYNYDGFE